MTVLGLHTDIWEPLEGCGVGRVLLHCPCLTGFVTHCQCWRKPSALDAGTPIATLFTTLATSASQRVHTGTRDRGRNITHRGQVVYIFLPWW